MHRLITVCVMVFSLTMPGPTHALAQQDPPPPPLGAVILDDPMTPAGVFHPVTCPTGLTAGDFVPDGYRLLVTGPCTPGSSSASTSWTTQDVIIPDGDLQFEFRMVSGIERASVQAYIRVGDGRWYRLAWEPAGGSATLLKLSGGQLALVTRRTDLARTTTSDAPHTIGIRAQGSRLWAILDGQPVLVANDDTISIGGISLGLERTGSADDRQETSLIAQHLRVTALAGSAQDRVPTVRGAAPSPPASAPSPSAAPTPGSSLAPPSTSPAETPGSRAMPAPVQIPGATNR